MEPDSQYVVQKQNFDSYYEQNILPMLQIIEKTRKKYFKWFVFLCLTVLIWIIYIALNFKLRISSTETNGSELDLVMCIMALFVCMPMFLYYRKIKESLLPLIIGYFGNFQYGYKADFSDALLKTSRIMPLYDQFETDDTFHGIYQNIAVNLAEYTLRKQVKTKNENTIRYTSVKTGHVLIFQSQMNKKFEGQTIVVKDKGLLNTFTHYKGLNRVGLESPDFERAYEVFSDNQIEARYILTALMLDHMLALKESFSNINYSFFNNQVLINIEVKENFFECSSFFTSVINKKRIDKIFDQLYRLFAIIEILQLNQKRLL